jgi:hypothetical protein
LEAGVIMENIKYIFSFIFIILGICIITVSKIAEEVVPKNGFYNVHLSLNYWIGALCVIGGIIYLIKKSKTIVQYLNEINANNKAYEEDQKNHKDQ